MQTRIIFIGTAEFGVPVLKAIIKNKENNIQVITQPDRIGGRGNKILPPPVKKVAMLYNIEIMQPENINEPEIVKKIIDLKPDIILVVAYGQILSEKVLDIPKIGCINIHGSLLPAYRGAAPINWAIINGEKETGITYIYMKRKVDAGDMIAQFKIDILPDESFGELSNRLSKLSAETVDHVLDSLKMCQLHRITQNKTEVSFTRKMTKKDGEVNWNNSSGKIYDSIRGTTPYPGAYTYYKERKLKIIRAKLILEDESHVSTRDVPGTIVAVDKEGLYVATGDCGRIRVEKLIPAGAKEMTAGQFINGNKIKIGDILTNK